MSILERDENCSRIQSDQDQGENAPFVRYMHEYWMWQIILRNWIIYSELHANVQCNNYSAGEVTVFSNTMKLITFNKVHYKYKIIL